LDKIKIRRWFKLEYSTLSVHRIEKYFLIVFSTLLILAN